MTLSKCVYFCCCVGCHVKSRKRERERKAKGIDDDDDDEQRREEKKKIDILVSDGKRERQTRRRKERRANIFSSSEKQYTSGEFHRTAVCSSSLLSIHPKYSERRIFFLSFHCHQMVVWLLY